MPIAPTPSVTHPPPTSANWSATIHAACAAHNAQVEDGSDASRPLEPDSACADKICYSLDDDVWLASAFADHSDTRWRIDHLRHRLDIEELHMDELEVEDAIGKHHLMVQARHQRDGLLHRLSSSYTNSPQGAHRIPSALRDLHYPYLLPFPASTSVSPLTSKDVRI